jgi:hypothetical protein
MVVIGPGIISDSREFIMLLMYIDFPTYARLPLYPNGSTVAGLLAFALQMDHQVVTLSLNCYEPGLFADVGAPSQPYSRMLSLSPSVALTLGGG